jgi:hypothetical protein
MSDKIEFEHHHELVAFEVRLQHILLQFGPVAVGMSQIEIISPDGSVELIESVWHRSGNLNALWPLIGKRMERWIMDDDSFRLIFEDGTVLRRKYELANSLVEVWGPDRDNFTPYPQALVEPSPEAREMMEALKRKFGL